MKFFGFIIMLIAIFVLIYGGIVLGIYDAYDLIINWGVLNRVEIFWDIIWIIFRDLIVIIFGFLLFIIGRALFNVNKYKKK